MESPSPDLSTLVDLVAAHPLFALLDRAALIGLCRGSAWASIRRARSILKEGQAATTVFFLITGSVRVFHRSAGGQEVLVKLFRGPALFGEMEALVGRPYLEHVVTLEPCTLLRVPAKDFADYLAAYPRFASQIVYDLSERLCIATCNERALAFNDVDTRLAMLLLDYLDLFGQPVASGVRLDLKVTQRSLAADLSATRRSVYRSLRALFDERILSKQAGRFVIHQRDLLERRASKTMGLGYSLRPKVR